MGDAAIQKANAQLPKTLMFDGSLAGVGRAELKWFAQTVAMQDVSSHRRVAVILRIGSELKTLSMRRQPFQKRNVDHHHLPWGGFECAAPMAKIRMNNPDGSP